MSDMPGPRRGHIPPWRGPEASTRWSWVPQSFLVDGLHHHLNAVLAGPVPVSLDRQVVKAAHPLETAQGIQTPTCSYYSTSAVPEQF